MWSVNKKLGLAFAKIDPTNISIYYHPGNEDDAQYLGTCHTFPGKLGIVETERVVEKNIVLLAEADHIEFKRIKVDEVEVCIDGNKLTSVNCRFGSEVNDEYGRKKASVPPFSYNGVTI